jgi:hypothetical protein
MKIPLNSALSSAQRVFWDRRSQMDKRKAEARQQRPT